VIELHAVLTIAYRDLVKFLRDPARLVSTFIFPLLFIVILGGAVLIHEIGHFVTARLLGVRPHLPAHEHISRLSGSRMPRDVVAAMAEANEFVAKDPVKSREILGRATHVPPDVLASAVLSTVRLDLPPSDVDYWSQILVDQKVIQRRPSASSVLNN